MTLLLHYAWLHAPVQYIRLGRIALAPALLLVSAILDLLTIILDFAEMCAKICQFGPLSQTQPP